jgi:hypothetical protein
MLSLAGGWIAQPDYCLSSNLSQLNRMLSTTKSQSAFIWAIILALIFVSASLYASDFKAQSHTTPSYVDLELSEIRVNESVATVTLQLIRSGDFRQSTTIDFRTAESEASEGRDYKGAGGTITFSGGESFKTVSLEIVADEEIESPESFNFLISSTAPNTQVGRASTTIWIEDAPVLAAHPTLEVTPSADGSVLLSWQSNRPCGLERTANPAVGPWEAVTCTPVQNGDRYEVIQPAGGVFYAFRLRAD